VDLICDTTNSIWELGGVRDDLVGSVVAAIFLNGPAVVDCVVLDGSLERKTNRVTVDVLIANVFQTEINNFVRCRHNFIGIDIAREGIPGVPS
jgi:hypothetical protein